jgi:hypothetical protein
VIPFPRPSVPFDGCHACGGTTRIHPTTPHVRHCNDCGSTHRVLREHTVTDDVARQRQAYGSGPRIKS